MNTRVPLYVLLVLVIALMLTSGAANSQSRNPQTTNEQQGSVFTYQGRLASGGSSVNGTCNFQFSLWDADVDGTQIGSTVPKNDVAINKGLFTVDLDFGSTAFNGQKRWLQTQVRCLGDVGFTTLGRQAITATPYALYSLNSDKLDGHDATDFELPSNVLYVFSSNLTTDGNGDGRPGMNAICIASDPASHFCNQAEIENAYSSTGVYIASPFTEAWMDNVFYYTAYAEMRWDTDTCSNWTNDIDGNGITMRSTKPSGKSCVNILPVTCCKWTP
jgi:hypothetical protein